MQQLSLNGKGKFLANGSIVKPVPVGHPVSIELIEVPERELPFEISQKIELKKISGANCYVLGKPHTDWDVTESPVQVYPVQFYRI